MSNKAAYFYLIPEEVSRDRYAHNSLVLAEGLRDLGWDIYANVNYWKAEQSGEYLFRHDESINASDCQVNVLTYDWLYFINVIPFELLENTGSIRVYLEDAGWLKTPGLAPQFRLFDYILKSHYNSSCAYPSNYRPWAFGLTNRIVRECADSPSFCDRDNSIVVNFGATHSSRHRLRDTFEKSVYPKLEHVYKLDRSTNSKKSPPQDSYHKMMWEQTAWRHYPDYYERLKMSKCCSCVGGQLVPGFPRDASALAGGGRRKQLSMAFYQTLSRFKSVTPRWNQWESWRWWESLTAGSVSLMLDFEKYGALLPVQPVNWEHYVGLDLDCLDEGIERMLSDDSGLELIAVKGREWALKNYSPHATALRFLDMIGLTYDKQN